MSVVVAEGVIQVTADASGIPREVERDVEAGRGGVNSTGVGLAACSGSRLFVRPDLPEQVLSIRFWRSALRGAAVDLALYKGVRSEQTL